METSGRAGPTFPVVILAWIACVLVGAGVAMAQSSRAKAEQTAPTAPPAAPSPKPAPPLPTAAHADAPPAHATRPHPDEVPKIEPAGHGWFALPAGPNRGTALLHLPPRPAATGAEPGMNAERSRSAQGVVRFAPGFPQSAEYVAWWQNRVYVALQADRTAPIGKGDFRQRILTLSAVQSAGGGWEYPPGRPALDATLPARSVEMVAFGACRFGPVALIRHSPRSGTSGQWVVPFPPSTPGSKPAVESTPKTGDLELLLYAYSQWHRLALPWAEGETGERKFSQFWLVGEADAIILDALDTAGPEVREFTTRLPLSFAPGDPDPVLVWKETTYPLKVHTANIDLAIPKPDLVCRVEGASVAVAWTPENRGEVRLFWLRADRAAEEGPAVEDVPKQHVVVPMDGSGRIAVIWADASEAGAPSGSTGGGPESQEPALAAPGSNRTGLEICEVSATTGKPLYRGPLKSNYWITTREYQALVAMLVVVMGAVLVFVLRTEPTQTATLPKGVVLAEPGRRFLAAVLDYLPAAMLVESLFSLPTGTLLLPSQMMGQPFTIWALLTAFGLSAAHATLGEWLFGRSLGKLLTGCVVASVRPHAARTEPSAAGAAQGEQSLSRPVFWQCLVRNLVKWFAPVLGLFMLVDINRRHPGDLLAKTLVLMTASEQGEQG